MGKNLFTKKLLSIFLIAAIAIFGLSACDAINGVTKIASIISKEMPSKEDTYTSLVEINAAMVEAMSGGETEFTFNATGVDESDLQRISENLSTFWGHPVLYSINSEFEDIEGIVPGQAVDVKNITNSFELSDNYFVFDFIKNGTPIPEDRANAKAVADELSAIAAGIFQNEDTSDYEKTLAAHDWLVANVEYDAGVPEDGHKNGSYGAFVDRRTMCQGYAEGLELLLKCYTDIEVVQMVGEAQNSWDGGAGSWGGHAWNAVRIDGTWYQIDTTFDDPTGNPSGNISHFYFGQTDTVMRQNHRWNAEYFPVSDSDDFLYFRQSGLFAENWDAFVALTTAALAETPASSLELAVVGQTIDEENIQFIYNVRDDIEIIRWSEQSWNDIHVHSIEIYYA